MDLEIITLIIEITVYAIALGFAYGRIQSRLRSLEIKMDKHNNFIERLIIQEQRVLELRRMIEEMNIKKYEKGNDKRYEN